MCLPLIVSQADDVLCLKGVPPVTVAEWTLQGDGNLDFYDGIWLYLILSYKLITAHSVPR